jgi:hypothetical protein
MLRRKRWFLGLAGVALLLSGRTSVQADERATLIDSIAGTLQAEYVYPDVAAKLSAAVQRRAKRGDYAAISDNAALAQRLTRDLREVSHDKHLAAEYHAEGARAAPEIAPREELDRWRAEDALNNFRKVEHLDGNVGYLEIRGFHELDLAAEVARAAIVFVAHCDALIIDLRANRGGDPAMVAFVASFFFDERTHLNDVLVRQGNRLDQFWTSLQPGPIFGGQKPLYILTSKATFSAAEDFTYALKNLKRAVVVGEATGGGAHPTRMFKVSEHFALVVPFARSTSPITQQDWEGAGISPDIAVPASAAFDTAYRAALQRIAATTADAGRRRAIEALLGARGAELGPKKHSP